MRPLLSFSFVLLLSSALLAATQPQHVTSPPPATATVKVGVIMDLTTAVGRGCLTALNLALTDFYTSHPNSTTRLQILQRHSLRNDAVSAASAALDLLSNHRVAAILGPQTSSSAAFVAEIGRRAQTPIISFSATSPSLSPYLSSFLVRATPSDAAMGTIIAALASAFSWRRIVPIYENDEFGASILPNLIDAVAAVGESKVPYRCPIHPTASDDYISMQLYRLKTLQTRVFVLHSSSKIAARILSAAAAAGMNNNNYAWILTSAVAAQLGSFDPDVILDTMQGDIGIRPYIHRSERVRQFERRWRQELMKENPNLNADFVFGDISPFVFYAYDALWAVAMAAENISLANPTSFPSDPTSNGSSFPAELFQLEVSKIGPKLLESIRETEFDGIGGRFRLINGERNISAFQIVNVNGEKAKGIGFWTPSRGFSKNRKSSGGGPYSVKREDLGQVIWPGDSLATPKGWEMPTGGAKMKLVVPGPVEPGFQSFLSMNRDPATGYVTADGFVIEVFEAAVRRLPYALPFEYVSWVNAQGKGAGDYNALMNTVANETYDGVVGDVTITSNRSEVVDFTLPYTVSGVSMVVPLRDVRSHRAWIFLKPLNFDLWLVSGAFFIFTGAIVWFLEHRTNPEFRGPPTHQLGTVFYFSFSTLVFAHKETMTSNLSKFVVTIWVFVVLILTSSYTASLTSMLTVRQFQPTITDYKELIVKGLPVGHLRHSFVKQLLIRMGFNEKNLFPYKSPQEYKDALSNGTIVAVIDEIPYLKIFLSYYCENFTMGSPIYKTSGFGYAFPKGSPLVSDLSRAILSLTESNEILEIERRWFGELSSCPKQGGNSISSSNSLDFNSFYGLFLITGVASILALIFYSLSFLYTNRRSLASIAAEENTLKGRVSSVARLYDGKDISSHTFKKLGKNVALDGRGATTSAGSSPRFNADQSESPFSISLGTTTPPSMDFSSHEIPQGTSMDGISQVEMASPQGIPQPR
ncbi:hypothetical protein HPP92_010520 [Vanilla planifolia]|uniref:Glutamate receptor n=1 Tax=Vanilla planifolia TaxID=51239 RepID=A0A835QZ18_VANPL|nr:hypothetical protein HPP92_010520 [Vanilla planifolia]